MNGPISMPVDLVITCFVFDGEGNVLDLFESGLSVVAGLTRGQEEWCNSPTLLLVWCVCFLLDRAALA